MSNNNSLVSIVTTCYNSEETIERTVNSVLNQTYEQIEYIIIDAASTDHTQKILDKYSYSIDYFESKEDNGIAEGWNRGIKKCNGEYIQILNADDYLDKNKIAESVKCLNDNPEVAYVFGDLHIVNKNEKILHVIKGDEDYDKIINYRTPRINHPTVMVKKCIFEKYGFFIEDLTCAMDYEWLLRLHKQKEIGIYCDKIITYMQEGGKSENSLIARKEEYQVAVLHGQNKLFSLALHLYLLIRTNFRIFLENYFTLDSLYKFRRGVNKPIKGK